VLGILLSLLSAATFAFNNASARRGVLSGSALQSLAITVPIGVPLFVIVALASGNIGRLADFSLRGLAFLSLAGLLHFIFGRYCNVRASKAIGLTLSAPIVQLNLLVTLALAIAVLGERLTPLRILGIVLIIIGAALMRQGESKPVEAASAAMPEAAETFRPHYAEGYLFALLCAAGYGVTPILVRSAIGGGGPGTALAAGVVSYGAATVLLAIFLLLINGWRHAIDIKPEALKWFTSSGVFVCVSQMLIYMAYSLAPLSVVVPIQQLSLLFRYLFAYMLTPEHEIFGSRVIIGTVCSLVGAASISASTEFVLSLVTLPNSVVDVVRWQWP
jgi:drug/metabolite transporter (DMT)-like permease